MFHVIRYTLFILLWILLLKSSVFADIRLNEVLIEPDQSVELINTSSDEVDISSWYIDDSGGTTYYTIPQDTIIYPGSCLVFSSNFNLNKASADTVRIFNNTYPPTSTLSALIDSFSYLKSQGSGISFIRVPDADGEWSTASSSLNFFNSIEETCLYSAPTSVPLTPTLTPTPTPTTKPDENNSINIKNVYISEVMVAPESGENEWVELYNDNAYEVNLIDWYIDDMAEGGSTQKKFDITIPSYGYSFIEFKQSIFNNSADEIRLLNPTSKQNDSFLYDFSEKGKTFGRINFKNNDFCLQNPSKGLINTPCIEDGEIIIEKEITSPISEPYISTVTQNQKSTPIKSGSKPVIENYIEIPNQIGKNVLGSSNIVVNSHNKEKNPAISSLVFLSTGYSLLTVLSVSLKMKK